MKGEIKPQFLRAVRLMAELQGWLNGPVMEATKVAKTLGYAEYTNGDGSGTIYPNIDAEKYTLIGGDGLKAKIGTVVNVMQAKIHDPSRKLRHPAKVVKAETEERTKKRLAKKTDEPEWDLSDYEKD